MKDIFSFTDSVLSSDGIEGSFFISCDKSLLDRAAIHAFLTQSHWAKGISRELVDRSIENALCFGVYWNENGHSSLSSTPDTQKQIGFARVITDFATFAYLSDVFVIESFRGLDISKKLMSAIMKHPELQGLRRWLLVTTYAQGLYEQFGFSLPKHPERMMEIFVPNLYQKEAELLNALQDKESVPIPLETGHPSRRED